MPVRCFYSIYYADGGYEKVFRYEDMVACRLGSKKTRVIKEHKLTEKGWVVRDL